MSYRNALVAALTALMLLSGGCTMIPAYRQPDLPVADAWPGGTENPDPSLIPAADTAWRSYFASPSLQEIIERALDQNRDLKKALLTIEKARAAFRIQEADTRPVVSGQSSFSRQGVPEDLSATGQSEISSTFAAHVGVTAYELDFFGRVKSLNQAALETYLATREAALNTRITLIAQTAEAYIAVLADRKLLALARETWEAQKETYAVIKGRYEVGTATRLDLAQAATSVESARVSIAQYTRMTAQAENALTLLAGSWVVLDREESIDQIRFTDHLPPGLPSDILRARPDIREAEHRLRAANADIGAARAALYPSIRLTGALGLASDDLGSLLRSGAAWAWNFTPSLTLPIFNRQGIEAGLDQARVSEKIAVTEYERTVQTAFREVADQLAARKTYADQLAAQNALVEETRKTYTLSRARYQNGIDSFLTVLDSQRSLFAAQKAAITVKQSYLSNLVNLYRVLGGGRI